MPMVAIPAAMAIGSTILKHRAEKKRQQEQSGLWNQYLRDYGQGQQQILGGLTGAGYNPLGPQTSTSTGTSTGTTFGETLSDIAPYVTPEFAPLVGQVRGTLERRTAGPGATLPAGYVETGIRGINEAYAPAEAGLRNLAARRGISADTYLTASPVARARAGDIAKFRAQVPLTERELQNQDLQLATAISEVFGKGQRGRTTTRGTTSMTEARTATTPPNIGSLLQLLTPPAPQQGFQTGGSPLGSSLSGLAQLMAYFQGQGGFGGGASSAGGNP